MLRAMLMGEALAAATAGCSADLGGTPAEENVDREIVQGSRSDEVSTVGDLLEFNREGGAANQNLPVNKHLWRASLDTLSFLPLESTDPFSGVIATDWSANGGSSEERFKVTVYISEPTLEARSLRVAVFRETLADNGAWLPASVSETTPRRLEDAILTRARQLRVAELNAETG